MQGIGVAAGGAAGGCGQLAALQDRVHRIGEVSAHEPLVNLVWKRTRSRSAGGRIVSKLSVQANSTGDGGVGKYQTGVVFSTGVAVTLANAESAVAITRQDVDVVYTEVEKLTEQVSKTAGTAFGTFKIFFDQVVTAVKPAVDAATPLLQRSTEAVTKFATPLASDAANQAQKALKSAGLDAEPVLEVAKTAVDQTSKVIEGVKPIGISVVNSALTADPLFLAEGAGGLLLVYWFAPSLVSLVATILRGYAGDVTAAQALDRLTKEDYTLIDVRADKDKSKSGLPSLPRNAKNKYVAMPVEEFSGKIRGQLKDSRRVEAEVAAIKIAALKRLNRGSKVVILDSTGGISKIVARSLKSQGFKNAYVIVDGFDGGRGWVQSKLSTDSSTSASFAEIISPSRIIPAGTKRFGGGSSDTTRFKLLPGGSDD